MVESRFIGEFLLQNTMLVTTLMQIMEAGPSTELLSVLVWILEIMGLANLLSAVDVVKV